MAKKILIYSPYGYWDLHSLYEVVIGWGLRLRGADVKYICCDGVFTDCDVAWANVRPRTAETCKHCMNRTLALYRLLNQPFDSLSSYIDDSAAAYAEQWIKRQKDEYLLSSYYRQMPLAELVRSSVQSHFRVYHLELSNPKVVTALRSYLHSAALAYEGLHSAIEQYKPEILFCLNGRFFSHQVAFEIARRKSIRAVFHERGFVDDSLAFWENEICHSYNGRVARFKKWQDIPLSSEELEQIEQVLTWRETGETKTWQTKFTTSWKDLPKQSESAFRKSLGLSTNSRIIALFTSSEDEIAATLSEDTIIEQFEWIQRTKEFVAAREDLEMVIRVHPNSAGVIGTDMGSIPRLEALVAGGLPDNVKLFWPQDEINSYELIRHCSHVLAYCSTISLEATARGRPAMLGKRGIYWSGDFSYKLESADTLERDLEIFLQKRLSFEQMRRAYRFAYSVFVRDSVPFNLVSTINPHKAECNFKDIKELEPGRSEDMDRVCDYFLKGSSLYPAARSFSEQAYAAETEFLRLRFDESQSS